MKQVLLLRLEVRKLCRQFLEMFPLSLFLFLVSEHFPYLLLVSVPVLLDSLHPVSPVFLHLDSPAVLASDLDSPAVPASDLDSPAVLAFDLGSPAVPVSDLGSLASAPAFAFLRCIPSDLLLGDVLFLSKLACTSTKLLCFLNPVCSDCISRNFFSYYLIASKLHMGESF